MAALLWAGARLVKRLPVGRLLPRADGPIRVVARTHLGAKERLCLIEVGSTSILLALTPTQIQTLHVWPQGTPGVLVPDASSGLAPERSSLDGVDVPGQLRDLRLRMTAPRR
jgi:flagellar biogenesis protein FliO